MKKLITTIMITLIATVAMAQTHEYEIFSYDINNDYGEVTKTLYGHLEVYKTGIAVKCFWLTEQYKADTVFASYRGDGFVYSDAFTTTLTNFSHGGQTYPSVTVQQIWDSCAIENGINLAPIKSYIQYKATNDPKFWKY